MSGAEAVRPSALVEADRQLSRVENFFAVVAAAILIFVTLSVCAEVLFRYGFGRPIVWVVEITEYSLLYVTFLGTSWALRCNAHVSVDFVIDALPPRVRSILLILGRLAGFFVSLILVIYGIEVSMGAFERGLYKPTLLEVPTGFVVLAIPVGSAMLTARFLIDGLGETYRMMAPVE